MLSLQPRSSLEIPTKPSTSLSYRRLRRPTPLPTMPSPLGQETMTGRLLALLNLRQA